MIPVAFVHIPKTAGRSILHAFEHAIGAERCATFLPAITPATFAHATFAAGHVQLSQIPGDVFAFTFLREPLNQLASHLRWLDRYNDPVFWEEVLPFSPSIRDAIARIGRTDFTCPASLQAFFDWLPETTHARLRNVQCEVLAARADRIAYTTPAEMARAAIAALPRLDFIGLAETLAPDLHALFHRLGLPAPLITHQNQLSAPRYVRLEDPAIRRVLARQVGADLRLYHHVLSRPPQPLRARLRNRIRPAYYALRGVKG
jgi:hypothetical protein